MAMVLFAIYLIIAFVFQLWIIFRCRGTEMCSHNKCKYRIFCHRYDRRCESRITPEEKEELLEYLKQLKSKTGSSTDPHF